jgi:hypothetical protein
MGMGWLNRDELNKLGVEGSQPHDAAADTIQE